MQNYHTVRDKGLDWGPTAYDLRHTFEAYGTYDIPIGKDRKVSIENGFLNQVLAGGRHPASCASRPGVRFC